ncbi:hypothetical protein Glove_89g38 [Diversispora epigaea]|uniref:DUF659 domain-containing protein n=1 Tax=Diversispora epigaea TaxID=1348612 RepID=A0A397JG40_9GLOM|nr:hypothetical protein Glove_89g38 [Diversispora epigaea]
MTKIRGVKFDEVWKYFIQNNDQRNGHYSATFYHCDTTWAREKSTIMKAHLTNICKSCPEDISKYWRDKLAEQTINYTLNSHLDKSLIKMWIITGVPFEIIENPFTIDFLKELNPGYTRSSHQELENAENLTLVLDGWTSIKSDSLYNFIIITSERKEYLIALKNFSKESHTGEMLANEIAIIIEKIGSEKFAAVVTDAAANYQELENAENLTLVLDGWTSIKSDSLYNFIIITSERKEYLIALKNFSKESHTGEMLANEIAIIIEKISSEKFAAVVTDAAANYLVKLDAIKEFITKCNKLCHFFHDSNKSNAYLKQGLAEMKIKSEGLKTWIKTRWESLYSTINSILKTQPVFDWILSEHSEIITNLEIIRILKDKEFFQHVDLFVIFGNQLKRVLTEEAIIIFNKRYEEFLHPIYTLTYFLYPHYRGHSDNSCKELLSQLRCYEAKLNPFNLTYTEIDTSQVCCERNFSTLKWLLGDHRTRMNITKLEGMTKVRSYYLFNICNELKYYGKELTENDIRSVINNTNMGDILELDDEESEIDINNNILNDNNNNSLIIGNIIDLNNFENENEISDEINDNEIGTLDYNPEDIINNFLFDELNETNNEMELNNRSNEMELNNRNDEMESN